MAAQLVAVDGLPGSGKTSLARALAAELDLAYVGTGAIFRAFTLAAIASGVADDEAALAAFLEDCGVSARDNCILVNGEAVSDEELRGIEVRSRVSHLAGLAAMRQAVFRVEREALVTNPCCVMEGQDIGTVVLPDAPVKLFLVALRDVRQYRRGEESGLGNRDRTDARRGNSPLAISQEAFLVDSSELNIEELVERIVPICRTRGIGI